MEESRLQSTSEATPFHEPVSTRVLPVFNACCSSPRQQEVFQQTAPSLPKLLPPSTTKATRTADAIPTMAMKTKHSAEGRERVATMSARGRRRSHAPLELHPFITHQFARFAGRVCMELLHSEQEHLHLQRKTDAAAIPSSQRRYEASSRSLLSSTKHASAMNEQFLLHGTHFYTSSFPSM